MSVEAICANCNPCCVCGSDVSELQAKLDMAIETLEWYSKYYRKPAMVEIGRKLAQETLDKLERKDDEL